MFGSTQRENLERAVHDAERGAMAELAREGLSRFAGYEVTAYDATAVQLMDEWIDRYLRQVPNPSRETRLLWISFLGEVFRRRCGGEWVIRERGEGGELAVLCPAENGNPQVVDVAGQVGRRISHGPSASLALSYTATCIRLKAGQ